MDEVKARGDKIDVEKLSALLNIPIIPISARKDMGTDVLATQAVLQANRGYVNEPDDVYDDFTHQIHHKIDDLIADFAKNADIPVHWASIKMLEGDEILQKALNLPEDVNIKVEEVVREYEASSNLGDRETMVADSRYRFIESVVSQSVVKGLSLGKVSITTKIDNIVTHKIFALPIFLLIMFLIFSMTFGTIGAWLTSGVEWLIGGKFSPLVNSLLESAGAPLWTISLIVDGVISGVGGILTFLPQIAILFFMLSLLEDSGYMSRVAFIMDRMLRKFGLSGKAFIPMLMGFGCTVPAVMAARTMENMKDRRMTIMLIPFMSCSAKLPIYGMFAAAFFPAHQGIVVFSMYILGMIVGIISGLIFKKTLFKGNDAPFVMELPAYRLPGFSTTIRHVWDKVESFIKKAATLIFAMSVLLWFLQSFNFHMAFVTDSSQSMIASFGRIIAPIFTPMGFGTWQVAVALITGLIAKEAVVSSLYLLYGISGAIGGVGVASALSGTFANPAIAYAFLVFVMLYVPCAAAFATMKRELGGWKWSLISVSWQMIVAYICSLSAYFIGSLFV